MLSYTFKNGKHTKEEIASRCYDVMDLKILNEDSKDILLLNSNIDILIQKKYTHVVLKNEEINIKKIKDIFYGDKRWYRTMLNNL